MVIGVSWAFFSFVDLSIIFGGIEWELHGRHQREQNLVLKSDTMVAPWDRRYYRQTPSTGSEVLLVKRTRTARVWVVVMPDQSLKEMELSHRASVRPMADWSLFLAPAAALSEERKNELLTQATAIVNGTGARVGRLPRYSGSEANRGKRFMGVLAGPPLVGARWLRWGLRSRARFIGMLGLAFLTYELMENVGFFEHVKYVVENIAAFWDDLTSNVTQASTMAEEMYDLVKLVYNTTATYIDPKRAVLCFLGVLAVVHALLEAEGDGEIPPSPSSSVGSSPVSSPPENPRESALVAGAVKSVAGALEGQGQLLAKLMAEQADIKNALMEEPEDRRAQELRMRMERSDKKEPESDILDEMNKRLKEFESILKEDRTEGSAGKLRVPESGEKTAEPGAGGPSGSGVAVGPASAVEDVTKKLKLKAMKPQGLFMRALEEYSPTDPEQWVTHFPPGYTANARLPGGWGRSTPPA